MCGQNPTAYTCDPNGSVFTLAGMLLATPGAVCGQEEADR
jgi:hypothetical protein